MKTSKRLTVGLEEDTEKIVNIHLAKHPKLNSLNYAINDIIRRYSQNSEQTTAPQQTDNLQLQQQLDQLLYKTSHVLSVSLLNYGMNIEISHFYDKSITHRGKERGRILLNELEEKELREKKLREKS